MPRKAPEGLKEECIRLRTDERLSLREIHEATGASKGSLSNWLRDHPLTKAEISDRMRVRRSPGRAPWGPESSLHKMVNRSQVSRTSLARVSEAAALLRMVLHGFSVYGSPFDGDKSDWVVEIPGGERPVRVQVKTSKNGKYGRPTVRLECSDGRGKSRRYRKGEFDFLVAYDLYRDACFVWTYAEVRNKRTTVTLAEDALERWDKFLP